MSNKKIKLLTSNKDEEHKNSNEEIEKENNKEDETDKNLNELDYKIMNSNILKNINIMSQNIIELSKIKFQNINFIKSENYELINKNKNLEEENINLKRKLIEIQIHPPCKVINNKLKIKFKNNYFKKTKDSYSDIRIKCIKESLSSIKDILNLENQYVEIKHDYELFKLYECIQPLKKLNNMIGLNNVKEEIFKHLIYYIKNNKNEHLLHTIITGPPGTGKTELGSIIAQIYLAIGALKNNIFKIVKRSDLIAGFLGQTTIKTQSVIDECDGGVLFIDEAYSLGNEEKRDSFSKECLDTINLNLTEKKNTFMCIIAGYPQELETCFFAGNIGLQRRFAFKYEIENYEYKELASIFIKKMNEFMIKFDFSNELLVHFFNKNYDYFPFFGGDIENFIFYSKLEASIRCFKRESSLIITIEDLHIGLNNFKMKKKKKITNNSNLLMYI
jgi:SpoVK/Ycf46/Vps4 family AAA+-type ATPase